MSPQAIVRAQARDALKGKYLKAVAAFVIALLPIYILEGADTVIICAVSMLITDNDAAAQITYMLISTPVMFVGGFLLSPLFNGFVRVFYRNALGFDMDMNDLFYYFYKGRYSRSLKLNISFALRMLLPTVLFYLPVIIYAAVCSAAASDFVDTTLYTDFYFILSVMSSIVTVLYSLKYFTVFTLFTEYENIDSGELFSLSKHVMRGQTGSAAKLIFSYTPWMLLCLTVLPIFYVGPYMAQGLTIGAKWMTRSAYERTQG